MIEDIYANPGAAQAQTQNKDRTLQFLQQMTPEERELFLQDYAGKTQMIDQQMSLADELRNKPTGGGVQAGNVFVAQSPLSTVAQGMNSYQAQKLREDAKERQREMIDEKGKAMGGLGGAIIEDKAQQRINRGGGSASGYGSNRRMNV